MNAAVLLLTAATMGQCPPSYGSYSVYPGYYYPYPRPVTYYVPQVYCPPPTYYVPYCQPQTYTVPTVKTAPTPKKEAPAVTIPYTHPTTQKTVENLVAVPEKEVKPKVIFSEEIKTTLYIDATMPSGKTHRIPVINGLLPNIRVGYSNGTLMSVEFHYDNPKPKPFTGKAGDKMIYTHGPKMPSITESVEKDDGYGGKYQEIRYQHVNLMLVPDRLVPALILPDPKDLGIDPPPDSKLKKPSEITPKY